MRPDYYKYCTTECEREPTCDVCGRRKLPSGRSAPMECGGCSDGCPGYRKEPKPGHLWPGELAQMDADEASP